MRADRDDSPDDLPGDDREDTFRTGPPGSVSSKVRIDDEADTGEMLAAVDPDDVLDDAGPTAKTLVPQKAPPPVTVRVVERVRAKPPELPKAEPKRAETKNAEKRIEPKKVLARKLEAKPKKRPNDKYDPFQVEDPPAVGVDPAVFPIHRSAPQTYLGQRIILGLVGGLIVLVMIGFMASGSETPAERAARESGRTIAVSDVEQTRRIEARRQQAMITALSRPRPAAGQPIDRAARVTPPKKLPGRQRPAPRIARVERTPYVFSDGKVKQPKRYGDHSEHVAPPGTGPMLILMSEPQALVFKDAKLFGATPLLLPVDADTQKMNLTLRTFGYKDKTIEVKPAASGNLEASVALEKDPAFEGFKVVNTEKPKDKS
jgi:hypothetical protein